MLDHPTFSNFSVSYCALFLFAVLVLICSKKDLSIFQKLSSVGAIFVITLMVFIVVVGV